MRNSPFLLCTLLLCAVHCSVRSQVSTQGLTLWLRADEGILHKRGKVSAWQDQSGLGTHAVVTTSDSPRLVASGLNGLPVIRFNGLNTGFTTPEQASFPGRRGTLLLVLRVNDRSSNSSPGFGNILSTFRGRREKGAWQFGAFPGEYSFYDGRGGSAYVISGMQMRTWDMVTLMRDGDTTMNLYRGGAFQRLFTVASLQPDTNTLKIGYNGVSTSHDSISEAFNGDIAEILVYNRVLSADELEQVHSYLSKKWGIRMSVPFWKRWWFYPAAIVLALLLGGAATRIFSLRKYRRQIALLEKQAAIESERNRISRDMHDEIGSGLTRIAVMSEAVNLKPPDRDGLEQDIGSITSSARELAANMSEIIWALNPSNDTLENLLAYIREQVNAFVAPFPVSCNILFPEVVPQLVQSNVQRRNLYLATKEAVNNALKHSGASELNLSASIDTSMLRFELRDNGHGFCDEDVRSSANGLRNMRRRIEEIDGDFCCESNGNGTTISFSMPLTTPKVKGLKIGRTTFFTLRRAGRQNTFDL